MPHKKELRYLPARELRVATAPDGSRTLSGYAIVFGVRSVPLGGFTEVVDPGAVTRALTGSPDILLLNNHDSTLILSRTTSGTLKLRADAVGVAFECSLDSRSTHANDLAVSIERGDTQGCSFGFRTIKDSWQQDGGSLVRTLLDIDLFEISICGSPAYPQTAVSIRSCPSELRSLLKRSDDDENEDDDGCDCDCPECLEGDHSNCSDPDCIDEDCEHGEDSARSVALFKLELRIALANRL